MDLFVGPAPFNQLSGTGLAGTGGAKLSWSWTSDDALETLLRYRLWFSEVPFDETTLSEANEVFCDILPGPQDSVPAASWL